MSRVAPLLVVGLFAVALFAGIPEADAAHQWGHRFMIFGRILDASGEPAQNLDVTLAVESNEEPHPQMTVTTDCTGLYYGQQDRGRPGDHRTEQGRLHIHNFEWASRPSFFVATPYADYREGALTPGPPLSEDQLREYAILVDRADKDLQNAHANIQLDVDLEPVEACGDTGDWRREYVVRGKVQLNEGRLRQDQVSGTAEVEVTIETEGGPVTLTEGTNDAGEYLVVFENVSVVPGSKITAEWDGTRRSTDVDTTFYATTLNIVHRDWFFQETGFQVFMGILGGIVVLGAAVWAGTRIKDKAATKKAMERSTRKRANK